MEIEVILLENMDNLGEAGSLVKISRPGYARNYLLRPRRKNGRLLEPYALLATPENRAVFEQQREEIERRNAALRKRAQDLAQKLKDETENEHGADVELTIPWQAEASGKLYVVVRPRVIYDALLKQKASVLAKGDISPESVQMMQSITELGTFSAKVRLYPGVFISLVVHVVRPEGH